MPRPLLTSLLLYSIALSAAAQQTDTIAVLPQPIAGKTISIWPVSDASIPPEIKVITLARPAVRQRCRIHDLTPDTLICESSHHRPSTTYQRDQIAALMAAALAASFFVPLAWSITLRVFAGLFFGAFGAMEVGATGSDHGPTLLYQRPTTPLPVTLPTEK